VQRAFGFGGCEVLKRILVVVAMSFLLGACASTKMTSMRDPSVYASAYQRLLIVAPFSDLESRMQAENAFVAQLANRGIHGIPSISVFLPTRGYSDEEVSSILGDIGAEGVLLVTMTDAYTQQSYVPGSSTTTGTATLSGNVVNYAGTTQHYGGYYISKPRVHYELRLFDISTGKTSWVATSLTRGNAFAQFDMLIQSLAQTAVQKLQEDGMIK
jgi:hypothetical protein